MYPLTPSLLHPLTPSPLTSSPLYPSLIYFLTSLLPPSSPHSCTLTPSPLTHLPPHLFTRVPSSTPSSSHSCTPHSFTPSLIYPLTLYPLIPSLIYPLTPSLHSLTQFNSCTYLILSLLFLLSITHPLHSSSPSFSLHLFTFTPHSLFTPSFTCHLMFHINGTNNQSAYLTFPPGLP